MKTEMKMLDNGNYERIISPIQHECRSSDYNWHCVEYGWNRGHLLLKKEDYEGYSSEIEINFCPFCGYQPERLNEKTSNGCDSLNTADKEMQ